MIRDYKYLISACLDHWLCSFNYYYFHQWNEKILKCWSKNLFNNDMNQRHNTDNINSEEIKKGEFSIDKMYNK